MLSRRELLGGAVLLLPLLRARAFGEARCVLADPNELGPYYRAGAPERTDLCDAREPGDPVAFAGRILAAEDCRPVAGALVEVWHADAAGVYDMIARGQPRDPAVYHLRALLRSGADGSFAFDTVVPGHYEDRARHIHFAVHAEGYEPFITQSYFAGDPRIATDPIARPRNAVVARPARVHGRAGRRGELALGLRRRRPNPAEALAAFAAYEGDYRLNDGGVLHVARQGDTLHGAVGDVRVEMIFDSRDRFRVLEFDLVGHPEFAADGKVAALITQAHGDRGPKRATRIR
jgi:catechol 1,2-dioxygenase